MGRLISPKQNLAGTNSPRISRKLDDAAKIEWKLLRSALLTICVFTLLPFTLQAQNATGSLLGEVQDASGARIKSAQVTATDTGSGVARTATTDNRGQFRFPDLLPGQYHVTANAPGFAEASSDVSRAGK